MDNETMYQRLGVSRDADQDAIKKAYKKLARKYHPDVNPGDEEAKRRFQEVASAYEVLSDPQKRALYDEFGEDATKLGFDPEQARQYKQWSERAAWRGRQGEGGGGFAGFSGFGGGQSAEDLFRDLFGGAQGAAGRGPAVRGPDARAELETDFRTAALGGVRELTFADGRSFKVRVPSGGRDGDTIRIPGQGGQSPYGGPPGDLLVTLRVSSHAHFRREGNDLYAELPVTVGEAVRGASVEAPTLDGAVRVRVPAGAQSGAKLRVRGKGIQRGKGEPGDLYLTVMVRLPEDPPREAIDAIERSYDGSVRAEADQKAGAA